MHQPGLVWGQLWVLGSFVVLGPWARPLAPLSLSLVILQVGVTTWLLCTEGVGLGEVSSFPLWPPPRPMHSSVPRCPLLCFHGALLTLSAANIYGRPPGCRAGAPGFTGWVRLPFPVPIQAEGKYVTGVL